MFISTRHCETTRPLIVNVFKKMEMQRNTLRKSSTIPSPINTIVSEGWCRGLTDIVFGGLFCHISRELSYQS